MVMYKASFIHPYTHIPFIIYYNKNEGYMTLAKDEETLELVLKMQDGLGNNEEYIEQLEKANKVCETPYPCGSFGELFDFLEQIGVGKEDVTFQSMYLH
ncbi:hypothetical protein [Halalkalibacter hemicellulosilyticus]|nr:hypothetical protein [Halalkalibacter hemicellulosilyticus]